MSAEGECHGVQVLRGVAHTLQTERDSARTVIIAMQQDKIAANDQIMALQTDLNMANSRANNLAEENQALVSSWVSLLHTAHARLPRPEYDMLKLHQ